MERTWIDAFALEDLPVGGARLLSSGRDRVAVFRPSADAVHAVDNICPHEGYPLVKGDLADCTLTCVWHNYKFDLRDGSCLMGDEDVRSFPTRVVEGRVEVDVTAPDAADLEAEWMASLKAGLLEYKMGRVARDVVRLLDAGVSATSLLGWAAGFDARYAEYGTTHALPVSADALRLLARHRGVDAALVVVQPLDVAGVRHARRAPRDTPTPVDPGSDADAAFQRLRAHVEAERAPEAEALMRGALRRGWRREILHPWLLRLCSDHFLDFGHGLIYSNKVFDLFDGAGWDHAEDVLGALVFEIVTATREDLLPPWKPWRRMMAELEPELPSLFAAAGQPTGALQPWLDTVTDGRLEDAVAAVADALRSGTALVDVIDTLAVAAAQRVLRFDPAHDADPTVQNDWLDVTHILTFTNALRHAATVLDRPEVLKLVFQAVRFIQHHQRLDLPPEARLSPTPRPGGAAGVARAIATGDAPAAVDIALGCDDPELAVLHALLEDALLDDPLAVPIFAAHLLKTSVAAFEERAAMSHARRLDPVLAAVRFAASPVRERRLHTRVHEAIRLVTEGKVPRKLT